MRRVVPDIRFAVIAVMVVRPIDTFKVHDSLVANDLSIAASAAVPDLRIVTVVATAVVATTTVVAATIIAASIVAAGFSGGSEDNNGSKQERAQDCEGDATHDQPSLAIASVM
jgi:hypothetical protein